MPFFRVKPYCDYLVVIEGTTSCRDIFGPGSVVELTSINEGDQANRLDPLTDEDSEKHLETFEKKIEEIKKDDKPELGDLFSIVNDVTDRKKAAKEKLRAMAGDK